MSSHRFAWKTGLLGSVIAAMILLTPLAAASGSGYSLSFSQSAGHASNGAVDLVSVSSSDPGGSTISVTMSVAGTVDLVSSNYVYLVYFGGASAVNATAWASFTNGTNTWESSSGGGFGFGYLYPTVSGGTISFSMNKSAVGPSSTFAMNAYAAYGLAQSGATYSWLGSSYSGSTGGNGGGATCTSNATCQQAVDNALGIASLVVIGILLLVVIIVVVVVLVVVMRRRRTPPAQTMMPPPPMGGMGSPPPPPPPAQ